MQKAGRSGEKDAKKVGNSLEKVGDFRQKVERFCSKTPYFLGEIEERERGGLRFHERFVEKWAVGCCLVEGLCKAERAAALRLNRIGCFREGGVS